MTINEQHQFSMMYFEKKKTILYDNVTSEFVLSWAGY